jgi:hypothetical protein
MAPIKRPKRYGRYGAEPVAKPATSFEALLWVTSLKFKAKLILKTARFSLN